MRHIVFVGIMLVLLTACGRSSAPAPGIGTSAVAAEPAAIRQPVSLNVPHVRQQSANWCWLAVAQMVIGYKQWGASPSQCRLLEIGFGYPQNYCCGWQSRCDRGGTLEEIGRIVEYYSGRQVFLGPPIEPEELYQVLSNGDVVIARIVVPPSQGGPTAGPAGHTVVIKGIRWAQGTVSQGGQSFQAVVPMILVNDPSQATTVEATYDELARYWEKSIIVD